MAVISLDPTMAEMDVRTKLANPAQGTELVTFEPGIYQPTSSLVTFPARVPVEGHGAKLKCAAGGCYQFPEAVGAVGGFSVDGTGRTTAPFLIFGTGAGGKGSKAHLYDIDVSGGGAGSYAAMEVRNLQNSVIENLRVRDNTLCNGVAVIHGSKNVKFSEFWPTNCKEWNLLIDTLAGSQRTSKIVVDFGLSEAENAGVTSVVIGDAEIVKLRDLAMNTATGIWLKKSTGRTKADGTSVGAQGVSRLYVEGLEGNTTAWLKSDYPATVYDRGGHEPKFTTAPNVTLVPV